MVDLVKYFLKPVIIKTSMEKDKKMLKNQYTSQSKKIGIFNFLRHFTYVMQIND